VSPTILIADDHDMMAAGLRAIIEQELRITVVDTVGDGRAAIARARDLKPDIVVMDVHMPLLNGIEATREIMREQPDLAVIALSMHDDRHFIVEMFRAGARAYLLKHCAFDELGQAIKSVLSGKKYISPSIARLVLEDYLQRIEDAPRSASSLTAKERQVLQLLAEGYPTRIIADMLHVSVNTVDTHRKNIMEKLGLFSIAELTKYAIREGLTQL
jgi:DNA-binding NarL/FixJ family response regulator